jgi:hypothetical protein
MDEPMQCHGPPVALSPWDWGLGGDASGNTASSDHGEVPAASWLEAARVGEVGAPSTLAGFCAPFGFEGFGGSTAYFSA